MTSRSPCSATYSYKKWRNSFFHYQPYFKKIFFNGFLIVCFLVAVRNLFASDSDRSFLDQSRDAEHSGEVAHHLAPSSTRENETNISESPKIILFWTRYYDHTIYDIGNQDLFKSAGCSVTNCITTMDRSLLNKSDAIVFHSLEINRTDLPAHRFPHQRYIFYLLETMPYGHEKTPIFSKEADNYFNWTMSHRRDSDIHHLMAYGAMRRKSPALEILPPRLWPEVKLPPPSQLMEPVRLEQKKRLANKTKLVAWFSTNCVTHGKREQYVEQLKKYIPIDVYGKCGDKECLPRNGHLCNNLLDQYKFYLSFENSLCPDYVTEKLYRALERDVVPVVYGGVDYAEYAPPHSYIHVADFASAKKLAEYLLFLDKNDGLYVKYFDWKKDYEIVKRPAYGWCELCEKLNRKNPLPSKTYPHLGQWWDNSACYKGENFISALLSDKS